MASMATSLVVGSYADGILQRNRHPHHFLVAEPSKQFLGKLLNRTIFPLLLRWPGQSHVGGIGYPLSKKTSLLLPVRCNWQSDAIDGPIEDRPYSTYIDSNTGEPVPAMGARPSIPGKEYWTEDTVIRVRSAHAALPSDEPIVTAKPSYGQKPGSRRKKFKVQSAASESSVGKSVDSDATPKDSDLLSEEKVEDVSTKHVIRQSDANEDPIDEEELARKYGEPHPFIRQNSEKKSLNETLSNEELWWNWRKFPEGKEPWSAWHKRAPDVDTVMAAAMAETGQIKLFGDKPTVAEATLARARRNVFKEERLLAEEERKKEIGPMAYYQEWVKAWKKDTSKEAVQKHFEETGEDVHLQLLNMFQHQTEREYRIMMGTDVRIQRDPLTMRMRPDQKKAVFGGDPVYPTINYEQDPHQIIDYRGPNMHEPTPDMLEIFKKKGIMISRQELAEILDKEKAEELELDELDDAMAGAVDIGEKDDEDEDEEDELDWRSAGKTSISSRSSREAASKSKGAQKDSEKSDLLSDFNLFDDSEE